MKDAAIARIEKRKTASRLKVGDKCRWRRYINRAGAARNREKRERLRRSVTAEQSERQRLIGLMTNHENTLWCRAGYPQGMKKLVGFCGAERLRLRIAAYG